MNWINIEYKENKICFSVNRLPIFNKPLEEYIQSAATDAIVGKTALLLSGGLDSQLTYHCLKTANKDFDVFVMNFEGDNYEDQNRAKIFSKINNFRLKTVDVEVYDFLNSFEFLEYANENELSSPQYVLHCRAMDKLRKLGYENFIQGGNPFVVKNGIYIKTGTSSHVFDHENWAKKQNVRFTHFMSSYEAMAFGFAYSMDSKEHFYYNSKIQKYSQIRKPFIGGIKENSGFRLINKKLSKQTLTTNAMDNVYRKSLATKRKFMKNEVMFMNKYIEASES